MTPELVEPTTLEWRYTDGVVPAGSAAWTYAGRIDVVDALSNPGGLSVMSNAVAPAA